MAALAGVVSEREANAQDAIPATPARRVVEVRVAGGGADAASLDETVRELLGRLTLVMESETVTRIDPDASSFRSTSRPSLLARVGIDLTAQDVAVVTIVDGRTGDVTLRRTLRREGPPAVVREELAHIVQAAIDPMVVAERDRANVAPPVAVPAPAPVAAPVAAPAPAPPPEAPTPRDAVSKPQEGRAPLALDIATMAGAGSFASGSGLNPRAGGSAALVWRRGLRPSIGLGAQYVFPFEAGSQVALAHVGVASLRSMAALEIYRSSVFALDGAAGGGADVLSVEPRSNALPPDRLGRSTTRVDPIASLGLTGHLAIGAGTALSLLVGADVDLASRHWTVQGDGRSTDAFAPSRVRPLAMLGFTFTALGDSRFTTAPEPPR